MFGGQMSSSTLTDLDRDLADLAVKWRHAELNNWLETAEAHRVRLDVLLEMRLPEQRESG